MKKNLVLGTVIAASVAVMALPGAAEAKHGGKHGKHDAAAAHEAPAAEGSKAEAPKAEEGATHEGAAADGKKCSGHKGCSGHKE